MIEIAALSASAYTVIGVVIGSVASFVGGVVTNWTVASGGRWARRTQIRQERMSAILTFLEFAQSIERLVELRFQEQEVTNREEQTDRMWVLVRSLDLVATDQLRVAANMYAWGLQKAVYNDLTDVLVDEGIAYKDIYAFLGAKRDPFMDAARGELDVPTLEGGRKSWRGRRRHS